MYQVRNPTSGQVMKFRLCDTRGLEDGQGIDANDIAYLLDGNLPDGFHVCLTYYYNGCILISVSRN